MGERIEQGPAVNGLGPGGGVGKEQAPTALRPARVAEAGGQGGVDDPRAGPHAKRVSTEAKPLVTPQALFS